MSKRLIIVLALAFVVAFAFTAYAEVQNVKVSGDLEVKGILRNSLSLKDPSMATNIAATGYGETITSWLSITRVRVDADLTDNVSTTVRLLNERIWDQENAANTDINLDLAYATLKEFLYSPLTLTVGRQEIRFGNSFIIGGGANVDLPGELSDFSQRRSMDAIRANLNYDPLVLDFVVAKLDETGFGQNGGVAAYDDTDLYGVNAGYTGIKDVLAEMYLWQRTRDTQQVAGGAVGAGLGKSENLRTTGARVQYTGLENTVIGLEGAAQYGDHVSLTAIYPDEIVNDGDTRKVTAWALQLTSNYAFADVKYTPTVGLNYTYLTGDKFKGRNEYKGWDPMLEDQSAGTLYNKMFGYSNCQVVNINTSVKPFEDVKMVIDYYYLRFNQPYTNIAHPVQGAGMGIPNNEMAMPVTLSGVAGDPTFVMKPGKKYLGSEFDLDVTYDYTEDVQFGLHTSTFIPGAAFDSDNDNTATQVVGSMKVIF